MYILSQHEYDNYLEVKKSKFYAHIKQVDTEDEAKSFVAFIKNKYNKANHNVPVYRILKNDGKSIAYYYSDDGEPSKTSGFPIFNILEKENIVNICVVVTRFFGGIKLGTGGLVKAYSQVVKDGIKKCGLIPYVNYIEFEIKTQYSEISNIKYVLESNKAQILDETYLKEVKFQCKIEENKFEKIRSEISSRSPITEFEQKN